jgi:hypothetical protein
MSVLVKHVRWCHLFGEDLVALSRAFAMYIHNFFFCTHIHVSTSKASKVRTPFGGISRRSLKRVCYVYVKFFFVLVYVYVYLY